MTCILARSEVQWWGKMAWVEGIWGKVVGEGAKKRRHRGGHFAWASNGCGSHYKILAVISVMWEAIEGMCAQKWHNLICILKGLFWSLVENRWWVTWWGKEHSGPCWEDIAVITRESLVVSTSAIGVRVRRSGLVLAIFRRRDNRFSQSLGYGLSSSSFCCSYRQSPIIPLCKLSSLQQALSCSSYVQAAMVCSPGSVLGLAWSFLMLSMNPDCGSSFSQGICSIL